MMATYWSKNHTQLPPRLYSADVSDGPWPGHYRFRAYPSQGDHCTECVSADLEKMIERAEKWFAAGCDARAVPEFYSASY